MFNVPLVVIGLPVILIPVPDVAATFVTVPTVHDLLAERSKATPLIVRVLVLCTYPVSEEEVRYPASLVNVLTLVGNVARLKSPLKYCDVLPRDITSCFASNAA